MVLKSKLRRCVTNRVSRPRAIPGVDPQSRNCGAARSRGPPGGSNSHSPFAGSHLTMTFGENEYMKQSPSALENGDQFFSTFCPNGEAMSTLETMFRFESNDIKDIILTVTPLAAGAGRAADA